jgi:hypothetical protein
VGRQEQTLHEGVIFCFQIFKDLDPMVKETWGWLKLMKGLVSQVASDDSGVTTDFQGKLGCGYCL